MIEFTNMDEAGFLPYFFSEDDHRLAAQQAHTAYAHGGGWFQLDGHELHDWREVGHAYMTYEGDPAICERSRATLRNETIILFDYAFVAIVQADGKFAVARMD